MRNRPKLLIVEDKEPLRERYTKFLGTPPGYWLEGCGIVGFEIDVAASSQEAHNLIERSLFDSKPYEAILLDLRLPATPDDLIRNSTNEEHGRNLLKEINRKSCVAVVILTAYPSTDNLIHAIRFGAADFLIKPIVDRETERMLFIRLVKAVGVTREAIHRELWFRRLVRQKELDDREVYVELSRNIAGKADMISQEADEIEGILSNRYGIDPQSDANDPICSGFARIRQTCDKIVNVSSEQLSLKRTPKFEQIDIKTHLEKEIARVQPCYFHRDVELVVNLETNLHTMTNTQDLRDMFAELLFGALEITTEKSIVEFSARFDEDIRDIVVSATFLGEPIPDELMETLNEDKPFSEALRERWRSVILIWSLSRNIGVRIRAEYQQDARNCITLLIPVVTNGSNCHSRD